MPKLGATTAFALLGTEVLSVLAGTCTNLTQLERTKALEDSASVRVTDMVEICGHLWTI